MNKEKDGKIDKYVGDKGIINNNITDLKLEERRKNVELHEKILNLSKSMKSIIEFTPRIYQAVESFHNLSKSIAGILSNIDYSAIFERFNRIRNVILDVISAIKLPQFSEERKKELVLSYEKWGQYGWTLNPVAPCDQFYFCPDNLKQANLVASGYCKDEIKIFEVIRKNKRTKKDFEEAVYDFENKKYKSCALVLITLIESSIVRSQKKTRKVGKKAIENVEKRLENIEIMGFYQMLMMTNYVSCLKKLFEGENDFKPQPDVINRNFLCHGMLWRDVRRIDCMKLFLLYYNTLQFLEILYS